MTKKTKIYIGVGAGILLLGYLYLKRKQKQAIQLQLEQQGETIDEGGEERGIAPSGGGGGGGSVGSGSTAPVTPPSLFAPISALVLPLPPVTTNPPVTPSIRDVTNLGTGITIPSLGSGAGGKIPPSPINTPITNPIITPKTGVTNLGTGITIPSLGSGAGGKTPPPPTPTLNITPKKLAFDGTNNECFETGHCLTDL